MKIRKFFPSSFLPAHIGICITVLQITSALAADNVKTSAPCEDISEKCELYKSYCGKNAYVTSRCLKSCGACKQTTSTTEKTVTLALCADTSTKCETFKEHCKHNTYVAKRCQKTCGICTTEKPTSTTSTPKTSTTLRTTLTTAPMTLMTTLGCSDGTDEQVFDRNMMVGCDGAYTRNDFRTACSAGWHVATATEYYKYGGKIVVPSTPRWIDVAWDSKGQETSLDNWEGFFPMANDVDSATQEYAESGVQSQNYYNPLKKDESCIWVSTNEKCKLVFTSGFRINNEIANNYGTGYGCHCRGNGINGTHGVVCVKDYQDSCPKKCTNFPEVDTCIDGACFCGPYKGSPCFGTSDSCISGECKCGNAPSCSKNSNRCVNGSCKCGIEEPCSGNSDTCTTFGSCRCGPDRSPCRGNSDTCSDGVCKCGASEACPRGSCVNGTCVGCSDNQFTCDNGSCTSVDNLCDNFNDCGDGSDESGCNGPPTAGPPGLTGCGSACPPSACDFSTNTCRNGPQ